MFSPDLNVLRLETKTCLRHPSCCWSCILLDDLKKDLVEYVKTRLPKTTKLVRNEKREGLIRGRMIGASHATGILSCFSVLCILWHYVGWLFSFCGTTFSDIDMQLLYPTAKVSVLIPISKLHNLSWGEERWLTLF